MTQQKPEPRERYADHFLTVAFGPVEIRRGLEPPATVTASQADAMGCRLPTTTGEKIGANTAGHTAPNNAAA